MAGFVCRDMLSVRAGQGMFRHVMMTLCRDHSQPNPAPGATARAVAAQTLAALSALPEQTRAAFVLHRFRHGPAAASRRIWATAQDVENAIAGALYALLQAKDLDKEFPDPEDVAKTACAALADFEAAWAEREADGIRPP